MAMERTGLSTQLGLRRGLLGGRTRLSLRAPAYEGYEMQIIRAGGLAYLAASPVGQFNAGFTSQKYWYC